MPLNTITIYPAKSIRDTLFAAITDLREAGDNYLVIIPNSESVEALINDCARQLWNLENSIWMH